MIGYYVFENEIPNESPGKIMISAIEDLRIHLYDTRSFSFMDAIQGI